MPKLHSSQKNSYKRIISEIQTDLTPSRRLFSQIVHNSFIEKTSDILAATVARPLPLLCGGITSLLATSVLYGVAQFNGFALSGFEFIATFIIGWTIGLIIDLVRFLVKR